MKNDMLVRYWPLLGRYVDLSRPAQPEERELGDPPTVGGAGLVAKVLDGGERLGGQSVEIVFEYGMGVLIVAEHENEWSITAYANEDIASQFGALRGRPDYVERRRREAITRAGEALEDPLTMLGINPRETYEIDWRNCSQILASIALEAGA